MTRPFYENHLHWIPDPAPPAPRRLDDLGSPTSDPAIPKPPSEAHPRLPRRLRPLRRRKRRTAATATENSAPSAADLVTPPTLSANNNSAPWTPRSATQPRSSANDLPGGQPGTRSTPVKHPQSFTSSPLSQHPLSAANRNADRRSRLDHPEIQGVYKPARNHPRQDSTANRQRDNFSGFGLSSPAIQQPSSKSFSGSPSRQNLTDPKGEDREAGRQRPGIIYQLPRAARPDTRLVIDAALLEAAAVSRCERPPTVVDIPKPGRSTGNCLPGTSQHRGSRSPRHHSCKRPRNRSSGVYRPKKRSPHRGHWCE